MNRNQKCLDERQVGQAIMAAKCDWHTLLSKNQVAFHSRPSVLWARLSAKIITSLTLSPTQQEFFLLLLSLQLRNSHWDGFVQGHPASKGRAGLELIKSSQFKPIWFPLCLSHVSWERLCLSSQGPLSLHTLLYILLNTSSPGKLPPPLCAPPPFLHLLFPTGQKSL